MTNRLGLALVVVAAAISVPSMVSAQAYILQDDACLLIPACESGARCPDAGTHAVSLPGGCFCAPGDAAAGIPALCCSASTGAGSCPPGGACILFSDSAGGVCSNTATPYCGMTASSVSRATSVIPCHTTADGSFTPYWRSGDCDDDGVPNGMEVLDPLRDPCCADDAFCCHERGRGTPEVCCALSSEPGACCAATGADSIGCCLAQADYATCCEAASSITGDATEVQCCAADPAVTNPAASCCEPAGLAGGPCCEALGLTADACCGAGIFCPGDAGLPAGDAGVSNSDAGTEPMMDGGTEPGADSGPAPLPPDDVGFGGGGGCRCEVGARAPSAPLSLGLVVMGLAFVVRSRRRS